MRRFRFVCGLALGIGVLYHTYSLAFSFGISFDDSWNLDGLSRITDGHSALEFVFGGVSGPLGRPLALLSFLPHAGSWPLSTQDFLRENTLLHLINFLLVVWLSCRLAPYLPWRVERPEVFALFAGAWWASSPLLLSTSVMIVQRMTSLAAGFCLLGCISYIAGRERLRRRPAGAFVFMSAAVVGATALAALCKENGVLLPGLIAALEFTLLASRDTDSCPPWFRVWRLVFLLIPGAALLTYLLINLPEYAAGHQARSFSLAERLMTEPRILFTYLRLLFLPVRSELGPYHDDFPVSENVFSPLSTPVAILAVVVASWFAWRWRRGPLMLFSVATAWFLWGHVTESTVVPLELYFEHRNYLPSVLPIFAVSALLFSPKVPSRARTVLSALILTTSLFVLRELALLWGNRAVAAATWHASHPGSLRALQLRLTTLAEAGELAEYLDVLDATPPSIRATNDYLMMRLVAMCGLRDEAGVLDARATVLARIESDPFGNSVTELLDRVTDWSIDGSCPGLDSRDTATLLDAALLNRNPRTRSDSLAQVHEIRARLLSKEHNAEETLRHLESAFRLRPTLSTGVTMAAILASEARYDEAGAKLDQLLGLAPRRPFLRERWLTTIDELRDVIARERSAAVSD